MTTLFKRLSFLCDRLDTSIYAIEKGTKLKSLGKWKDVYPSWEKVLIVANYLDVSVDFLVGNSDNPYSHKTTSLFLRAYPDFAAAYAKFDAEMHEIVQKYHITADPALENLTLEENCVDDHGEDDRSSSQPQAKNDYGKGQE